MPRKREGFVGERIVVLPPATVDVEANDPLARSLYITDIGYYPQAEHHYCKRTQGIGQYVLLYCVDGSGWCTIARQKFELAQHQFVILPAGVPHAYGANAGSRWTIYWVHFNGDHAAIYAEGAQSPQTINIALNSRISERNNIFEELLSTLQQDTHLDALRYASSLLHHYLASMRYLCQYRRVGNNVAVHPNNQHQRAVEAALHYMQENLERRITLADVLQYVGYAASQFSHIFRQQMGCSPLSYFNRLKIEQASRLLVTTDLHINQICYKVGIADSLYFSRLFKNLMGMSPRAYRAFHTESTKD